MGMSMYDQSMGAPAKIVDVYGLQLASTDPNAIAFLEKQRREKEERALQQQRPQSIGQPQYLRDLMGGGNMTGGVGAAQPSQSRLTDLLKTPTASPFFQASADAGQEAAKRRLAQLGMGSAGNAALELQKQAQANMSGDFFRMADLLGNQDRTNEQSRQFNVGTLENARQFDVRGSEDARQFNQSGRRVATSWSQPDNLVGPWKPNYGVNSYWGT